MEVNKLWFFGGHFQYNSIFYYFFISKKNVYNEAMLPKNKVFEGRDAVISFLTPSALGPTPVVELPPSHNPFYKDKVRIFIKLVQFVPLGNIKSLPAFTMLDGIPKNELKKIKNLVEYSSGNTALSLSILAKHFGIPNTHAIITPDVPEHKQKLLQLVGTNLLISSGPASPGVLENFGGIYEAKMMGKKAGWHNPQQFINLNNPRASKEYIGKEIWKQFGNKISVFTASVGTSGTIVGSGSYLKTKNPNVKIIGATIKTGSSIPGPRGEGAIHKLALPWNKVIDELIAIDTKSAYEKSLELIRLGFFVGPSTGMQFSALLQKLKEYKKKNKLKNLRNKDGEIVCCFLSCDTMFPYMEDYFDVLPASHFPKTKTL
jgi:cysteine synthase